MRTTTHPRTTTLSTASNPLAPPSGAKNTSNPPPLLPPSLQPLVPPVDDWVKTGTQYYETLIQEEEKLAQQIPIYEAWQETVKKLNPPQTHLNAFHKPLIEAKEKEKHPWDFLTNTMSFQATFWPILLASWSFYENANNGNKGKPLATEAVKASDESAHVFATYMSEGVFKRFQIVEKCLAPMATALTLYNAVHFGHEAYKRSQQQTHNKAYATLQGTASGVGDFLYNFITGVLGPVVLITSIIHNPLIHSMQWVDTNVVKGVLKRKQPWLHEPKFLLGYSVVITGFSSLMIPILSQYIDPAISQFVNDVVYRFSNRLLKVGFPKAYHQQQEALATELTEAKLKKPQKTH